MNNNELYHYGVKGMRWKNHKYRGFLNGQYVYDAAQQAQSRINGAKRGARNRAGMLRAWKREVTQRVNREAQPRIDAAKMHARYLAGIRRKRADSLKGRPSVSDNKARARAQLSRSGVFRNRMYDARSSKNAQRLNEIARMTKNRARTAKKKVGEKYAYLDTRARENSKRFNELAGMTKRRALNIKSKRRAAAREIDRRRAEWERDAVDRVDRNKFWARDEKKWRQKQKKKLPISKLKGRARQLYRQAKTEVAKRSPAWREAAKDRYNKIKYTVRGKSRAAAFRANSKLNRAKRNVQQNINRAKENAPVTKARLRKQLGDAKFKVQDTLAKKEWDSHYDQAVRKVNRREAEKRLRKSVNSKAKKAKKFVKQEVPSNFRKSWNKRVNEAARKQRMNSLREYGTVQIPLGIGYTDIRERNRKRVKRARKYAKRANAISRFRL